MYAMLAVGVGYRVVIFLVGADAWIISLCPIAHFDAFACGSLLAISVKEDRADRKVAFLGIVGLAGIVCCIAWISHVNDVSLIGAYQLLSSSKNYLNNWFTGNIYLFISLLTFAMVRLLYLHD